MFQHIAGYYELYYLANKGSEILKFILNLKADGNVEIHSYSNFTYYGKAHDFQTHMVAINIDGSNNHKFYSQICFDVGGHLKVKGTPIERIFVILTAVTIDFTLCANLGVMMRIPKNTSSQPCIYKPNTPEWDELNQTHTGLTDYLSENSILRQTKKVNDNFL